MISESAESAESAEPGQSVERRRGRPTKYNTEEEKLQARRDTAKSFYYNYHDYVSLQKRIYYENNKEYILEQQRRRRSREKSQV